MKLIEIKHIKKYKKQKTLKETTEIFTINSGKSGNFSMLKKLLNKWFKL